MKKVDEIYPFGINTTIGPTGTIKRLYRNREYFVDRNYDMAIFVNRQVKATWLSSKRELCELSYLPDTSNADTSGKMKKMMGKLKSRKHALVEKTYLTSLIAYKKQKRSNARLIKSYVALNRKPEIIVFHDQESCFHYMQFRKENTAKIVLFIHGDGSDGDMFVKRRPKLYNTTTFRTLIKEVHFTYERCDRIVWISQLAKKKFCYNHPEYVNKTVAVVNGIDDMKPIIIEPSSEFKYRLVTTGTVCRRKGQFIIVEAMRLMNPEILKDTHLTIIGLGPDYARLVDLSEQYGLTKHINFMGSVPNTKVHALLCADNIYVLMSNNEGLPISILEAMRAGLPVISTRVAGIPEEVDDRNGLLIDPDITQLTGVLNSLPHYDWVSMGCSSRKRFENEFTFEIMRRNYANMFDGLE